MRSENLSSPEELLLVAIGDGKSRFTCGYLSYALAGAAFGDLLIAGKIAISNKQVSVIDSGPSGNESLDWVLAQLRGSSKPRRLSSWISRLGNSSALRHAIRAELGRRGLVTAQEKMMFGIIPHTVYLADPAVAEDIRRRVLASLQDVSRATARDVLELGVAAYVSVGLLRGDERKRAKVELQSRRDPVVLAVKQVIDEMDSAAATVAVIAASS